MMKTRTSIVLTVAATCLMAIQAHAVQYNVIDLGQAGEPPTYAFALNNNNLVVGQYQVFFSGDSYMASFSWDGGVLTGWHVFGNKSKVKGINDSGVMVGWSDGVVHPYTAYVRENGVDTDLPEAPGQSWSLASTINNSGVAVGKSGGFGVKWTKSGGDWSIADTLTVSGRNEAAAAGINEAGDIVGDSYHSGAGYRAIHWAPGTTSGTVLPYPAGSGSWDIAADINDDGDVVVGESISSGQPRPAIWENDGGWSGRLLGNFGGGGSQALAINNDGMVVGWSTTYESVEHAFIYDEINGMQDLNSMIDAESGWVLLRATGINEAGNICGYGTINGETHAFLLAEVLDADLNRDYNVDIADLALFVSQWLMCTNPDDPKCSQ